jgi:hypothetical protein
MASCAKDRTCTCTTTITDATDGTAFTDTPDVTTYTKISKKNAKNLCVSSDYSGQYTNNGVVTVNDKRSTVCTIK